MNKIITLMFVCFITINGIGISGMADNTIDYPIFNDSFDMVIITSEIFLSKLQPLVDHKNNYGISTIIKKVEDIYNEFEGRDNPEKIKYFIKHAIEQWNIKYILLVGDMDLIPMRKTVGRAWLYSGEVEIPTDHYYSDIYDNTGGFCSWDSNFNDKFGEFRWDDIWDYDWINQTIDDVDLYPDVIVGRLLCSNKNEVSIIVNKIINYETGAYGKEWFNRLILMGGDTSTYAGSTVYEGELVNDMVAQELEEFDFNPIRLWTSLNTFKPILINWEFTKGAGLVCYSGHGLDRGIATYPPLEDKMVNYDILHLIGILNLRKLPIVFLDACLTAKPDSNIKLFGLKIPCFAWTLTMKRFGGAIATIGATRRGYTYRSSGVPQAGSSTLCINFFKSYETGELIGDILKGAQENYLDNIGMDYYTLEEFILYGDPSLKVGGYS